jgi:hypothetical protein
MARQPACPQECVGSNEGLTLTLEVREIPTLSQDSDSVCLSVSRILHALEPGAFE